MLRQVEEIRSRISQNKEVRLENNKRVEEEVRHLVENLPPESVNHPELSDAAVLDIGLESAGVQSPFTWSSEAVT
jgi:hypothetical protein